MTPLDGTRTTVTCSRSVIQATSYVFVILLLCAMLKMCAVPLRAFLYYLFSNSLCSQNLQNTSPDTQFNIQFANYLEELDSPVVSALRCAIAEATLVSHRVSDQKCII
jgi:hypothetical protein